MAIRPIYNTTDKASTVPTVAGNALTAELATQAYPESSNKRNWLTFRPANLGTTTGATPTELFIDGIPSFRFRVAERSTCVLTLLGAYNNNVTATNTAFNITVAATNVGGTVTILANSTNVKFPNASTASIAVSVDAANQSLVFTATGVAGDSLGQWELRTTGIAEITDIG
jgi:hypothetical protein